jgi:hypothetical protein
MSPTHRTSIRTGEVKTNAVAAAIPGRNRSPAPMAGKVTASRRRV